MSVQWTLIAGFLYMECGIIIILLLPLIKPSLWRSLFRSRFSRSLSAQSNLYLVSFILILLLFFGESVRELYKYGGILKKSQRGYAGSAAFYEDEMRLFRAQRNFYLSGFSLFCLFIIKRLASLLSQQAILKADAEASRRQAEHLSEHLKQVEDERDSLLAKSSGLYAEIAALQKLKAPEVVEHPSDDELFCDVPVSDSGDKSSASKIPILFERRRRSCIDLSGSSSSTEPVDNKPATDSKKSKKNN